MTERLYRLDPYLLEFDARVVARREREGRPAVVLDRTAFYPEGGGQPWDTGTLGGVPVLAVVEENGQVLHVLERPLPAEQVRGRLNAARRRDHRQQHHGQHLLSRALVEIASARTLSFHLGQKACSIDLDRELSEEQLAAAARRANEIVWEARLVAVRHMSRREAAALGLEPKEDVGEEVRVVVVEGYDSNPCGGTHPRNTAEVGVVIALSLERFKAGSRVHFVCGHRALEVVRERNAILDELGAVLSAPLAALAAAARQTLERLALADKRGRELLDWALAGEARRLLAEAEGAPPIVVAAYDGWPAADVRTLAIKLVSLAPCVALLGSRAEKAHLVFAQSPGLGHDMPARLKQALAVLGGRGGGKGDLAQGGGERIELLDEALACAAEAIRRPARS